MHTQVAPRYVYAGHTWVVWVSADVDVYAGVVDAVSYEFHKCVRFGSVRSLQRCKLERGASRVR